MPGGPTAVGAEPRAPLSALPSNSRCRAIPVAFQAKEAALLFYRDRLHPDYVTRHVQAQLAQEEQLLQR